MATWTSGEPVSVPWRPCSAASFALSSLSTAKLVGNYTDWPFSRPPRPFACKRGVQVDHVRTGSGMLRGTNRLVGSLPGRLGDSSGRSPLFLGGLGPFV